MPPADGSLIAAAQAAKAYAKAASLAETPRANGNPDVSRAAAQHVAKALTRCHPRQRAEMLYAIIAQAEMGLAVYRGDHFSFVPERSFAEQVRNLAGVR